MSGKTRAEVARKLRSATANRDEGLVLDSKNQTVGHYLDQWLSDAVRDSVKQSTYENYEYIVRKHIKPVLGHRKLRDLAHLTYGSFRPLLERAGLSRIRFHDLRHTCATLLLSKGAHPKIVREMLGHASITVTLDTYSHVLPNMQHQAVSAMESALS